MAEKTPFNKWEVLLHKRQEWLRGRLKGATFLKKLLFTTRIIFIASPPRIARDRLPNFTSTAHHCAFHSKLLSTLQPDVTLLLDSPWNRALIISCRVCMTMFLHVFVHPLKQKFFVAFFFQNWILIAIQTQHPISNMHALDMKVWRNMHPSRIIWQISLVSALSGAVTLAWVCFCSFLVYVPPLLPVGQRRPRQGAHHPPYSVFGVWFITKTKSSSNITYY